MKTALIQCPTIYDTTGTVWPERQRFITDLNLVEEPEEGYGDKHYGMNWKMTAKTILIQLHHKIDTFEHINKHLVLVLQNHMLDYMKKEFSFTHLNKIPKLGDPMHFHSYQIALGEDKNYHISLNERLSTNNDGHNSNSCDNFCSLPGFLSLFC